jgi:hypothetical protein
MAADVAGTELGLILSQGKPGVKKNMYVPSTPLQNGTDAEPCDRHEAAKWYRTAIAQGASGVGLSWVYKVRSWCVCFERKTDGEALGQVYGWGDDVASWPCCISAGRMWKVSSCHLERIYLYSVVAYKSSTWVLPISAYTHVVRTMLPRRQRRGKQQR